MSVGLVLGVALVGEGGGAAWAEEPAPSPPLVYEADAWFPSPAPTSPAEAPAAAAPAAASPPAGVPPAAPPPRGSTEAPSHAAAAAPAARRANAATHDEPAMRDDRALDPGNRKDRAVGFVLVGLGGVSAVAATLVAAQIRGPFSDAPTEGPNVGVVAMFGGMAAVLGGAGAYMIVKSRPGRPGVAVGPGSVHVDGSF